ncbi:MAG: DUF1217 domain-containing protein [Amaricoccus sp.]|uniref:DUF1217 domain-containing protein n=1 Tax=Amaricoccus sp. TaxID=1872485 RepID=UPI0039E6EA76
MSYTPVVPLSGIAGWRFLQRTETAQKAAFDKSAEVQKDVEYFTQKIGTIKSAADLVADRRLLKVALGAYGLSDKIDAKAFIRKALEEGTEAEDSFANRLADTTYARMAADFGFGNEAGAQTAKTGFAAKITEAYKTNAFQAAVGEVSDTMRLAMNFRDQIGALSAGTGKSWYTVLASKPLRAVFEGAYGLPASFVNIDIDKQRDTLAQKTEQLFGTDTLAAFQDADAVTTVMNRFLVTAQLKEGVSANSRGAAALTLLQSGSSSGSQGILNLLTSNG